MFKPINGNVKAVCKWIGNSPAVAMQHYAQVTEADLRGAAELSVLASAKKEVQNQVQIVADSGCAKVKAIEPKSLVIASISQKSQ